MDRASVELTHYLSQLLTQLPVILAGLTGIVLSLVFWRRHPMVSILTIISIVVLLTEILIGTYLNVHLPLIIREHGYNDVKMGSILMMVAVVRNLLRAICWGLLLAAIFGWRKQKEKTVTTQPA